MKIEVYTDGSCKPSNPGPAGLGFVIVVDSEVIHSEGCFLGQGTNNIAEIKAIECALEICKERGYQNEDITIYTDSQYAIGLLSKGWNPKVNIELINSVKDILKDFTELEMKWVKAHNGNKYNELADTLAKSAIDSYMEII